MIDDPDYVEHLTSETPKKRRKKYTQDPPLKTSNKPTQKRQLFIPDFPGFWETHKKMADKLGKDYKKHWTFW